MLYALALFVHILGAMGLFSAVSLMVVALIRMGQAATIEQVYEWAIVAQFAGKSLALIGLVILVPAVYMVIVAWGITTPWVMAALLAFFVLAIIGAAITGTTIQRLVATTQAAKPGPIPDGVRTQLLAPRLWLAEAVRVMLVIGILCLMILKPNLLYSLFVLLGMLFLGLLLGTVARRFSRPRLRKEQVARI